MATTYAIPDGRTVMAATTYTGTGAARSVDNSVNGISFQPDWVWIKNRTTAYSHLLADSVRGTTKYIVSSSTGVEVTDANSVTAFNANGFSVGTLVDINASGNAIVAWQWNAGGSTVTNTSGSISAQVRANTTAGFSVVTFTAQASGTGTFGHGLGVAPSMVIVKQRASSGSWGVYHISVGNGSRLLLDSTAASVVASSYWNNTSPTSTVVTIGSGFATAGTMVAYCFAPVAGYSAFGSYTGNGSADGPFVYTGFRPRFILIKGSSFVSNWFIQDSSRNGYNVNSGVALRPNLSNVEDGTTTYNLDILSNGFKLRSSATDSNTNGATFIWAAFAENPFKYANAR